MKIITWNINGYRSVTGQNPSKKYNVITKDNKLFKYIELEKPDIICLQETKTDLEQIDEELRYPKKYNGYYYSCQARKGYSGVVTFSKKKADYVNSKLGVERFDSEGRIVETHFGDLALLNIYFPKGYAESDRLQYKLDFYDELFKYLKRLMKKFDKIVVCGDFNTAHKAIDLARPEQNETTSGFIPIEREKLDILEKMGFSDAFRLSSSEGGHYSWWSQRGRSREKNIGWRIDYHFISKGLTKYFKQSYLQPNQEGSDHCPVILELK